MNLAAYDIQEFIAPGGSSAVFAAQRKNQAFQADWKVAIKFVWDVELAKVEAKNLANLAEVSGVVTLIDYFETPFADVAPYLPDLSNQVGYTYSATVVREQQHLDASSAVGVLVLQFLRGAPLIRETFPIESPADWEHDRDHLLVRDRESGQWFVQTLASLLGFQQRLRLLLQIVKHIEACHRQNIVHGDLKPQNILYNPENEQVTIFDFGGATSKTRGSPGWQAPEHLQVAVGDLDQLPLTADIFLLGLFIHRYMHPFGIKGFDQLANRCLGNVEQRPTCREIIAMLAVHEPENSKHGFSRLWVSASVISLVLVAMAVWFFKPPLMDEGWRNPSGLKQGAAADTTEMARGELILRVQVEEAWRTIRSPEPSRPALENAAQVIAQYRAARYPERVGANVGQNEFKIAFQKQRTWWFWLGDRWIGLGSFLKDGFYVSFVEILPAEAVFKLHLRSPTTKRQRIVLVSGLVPIELDNDQQVFMRPGYEPPFVLEEVLNSAKF